MRSGPSSIEPAAAAAAAAHVRLAPVAAVGQAAEGGQEAVGTQGTQHNSPVQQRPAFLRTHATHGTRPKDTWTPKERPLLYCTEAFLSNRGNIVTGLSRILTKQRIYNVFSYEIAVMLES